MEQAVMFSLDTILIDRQGTMMHVVINKAYMEKLKPIIDEEDRPMENNKILNFLPTTTLKKIKNIEDIPKHSFKFINTDMLSERVNVNMYLSNVIGVAAHIGHIEEIRTNFGLTKIRDTVLLIE
ncbi:hypothetical protein PVAP13_8KG253501 [Panicum virgatum]|uniref:Uncharacterized protein n=1 Tax=Panicum virgatum TaxID=38727 RepID=A0A8T0PPR5_PANVG|nr:hypothetical protein PVAP13_8KG253501 [Panicum virgatum]